MRVVVVGAGPAGLIALRSLQKMCEPDGTEFVCYERRGEVGGEWVFMGDHEESYDKSGHPMNTTVYKELQMNTPTVIFQPHPDHAFPEGTTLYPKRDEMCKYLKDFSDKFNLAKYIKFGTMVSDVRFCEKDSRLHMKVIDLKTGNSVDEVCDYIYMAVGQYNEPCYPDVDLSKFTGESLHYHFLKDPARLNGKRLLVVGSSWGAMDMVIVLNRPNRAASIDISWHVVPPVWIKSVKNVKVHTQITSAEGKTVHFSDGTSCEVDVVVFCSGFKQVHHPLCDELQLNFDTNRYLFPLYKHFVHPKCPRIFFLGKANTLGLFMMRPQAECVCKIIKGEVKLPSEAEMLDDIAKFQAHWGAELLKTFDYDISKFFPISEIEFAACDAAVEMSGVEPMQPSNCIRRVLYEVIKSLRDDVMNYKNYVAEYRENPEKPGEKQPYLVPPTSQ